MFLSEFLWKYRRPLAAIGLLSLSILLTVDSLHRRWVERFVGTTALPMVSPVQKTAESARDGARNLLFLVPDLLKARAQNVALKRRVGELEQEVLELREQLLRQQQVFELNEFAEYLTGPKIIARVIGTEPGPWSRAVLLDKGTAHGVKEGAPVISSSGLVGHVVKAYYGQSRVLLLTDMESKVSVLVQRNREQCVIQGDDGGCMLKYIEPTADIAEGDIIITSGIGPIYPKGLLVGWIGELSAESGDLFKWAKVVPAADFEKLEMVMVLPCRETPDELSDEPKPGAAPEPGSLPAEKNGR
ncbi:MAG: hypothetical protein Kow0099_28590 [Candidatus Abyssubacteria bacterium]